LNVPFVERYDVSGSLADTEGLIDLARHGRLLVFFPEGTFTRRAGLSGFYMGAFKVAAEASLPIFPGIIRGTRSMLRGDQWFPRRASVASKSGNPYGRQERILRRSCGCGMMCTKAYCRVVANLTWSN